MDCFIELRQRCKCKQPHTTLMTYNRVTCQRSGAKNMGLSAAYPPRLARAVVLALLGRPLPGKKQLSSCVEMQLPPGAAEEEHGAKEKPGRQGGVAKRRRSAVKKQGNAWQDVGSASDQEPDACPVQRPRPSGTSGWTMVCSDSDGM